MRFTGSRKSKHEKSLIVAERSCQLSAVSQWFGVSGFKCHVFERRSSFVWQTLFNNDLLINEDFVLFDCARQKEGIRHRSLALFHAGNHVGAAYPVRVVEVS